MDERGIIHRPEPTKARPIDPDVSDILDKSDRLNNSARLSRKEKFLYAAFAAVTVLAEGLIGSEAFQAYQRQSYQSAELFALSGLILLVPTIIVAYDPISRLRNRQVTERRNQQFVNELLLEENTRHNNQNNG